MSQPSSLAGTSSLIKDASMVSSMRTESVKIVLSTLTLTAGNVRIDLHVMSVQVDSSPTIECAFLAKTDSERTVTSAQLVDAQSARTNSSSATGNASTVDSSQDAKTINAHKQVALHAKRGTT